MKARVLAEHAAYPVSCGTGAFPIMSAAALVGCQSWAVRVGPRGPTGTAPFRFSH